MAEVREQLDVSDDWAEDIWERPAPSEERLARYRQHDPNEASHYVRHTAHLPKIGDEAEELGAFWMRLLRRASSIR